MTLNLTYIMNFTGNHGSDLDRNDLDLDKEALSEEDKIQELMTRSDTAVIFPEPVSDHEDNTENVGGSTVNGNTEQGMSLMTSL